jgi:hypothetical protein
MDAQSALCALRAFIFEINVVSLANIRTQLYKAVISLGRDSPRAVLVTYLDGDMGVVIGSAVGSPCSSVLGHSTAYLSIISNVVVSG